MRRTSNRFQKTLAKPYIAHTLKIQGMRNCLFPVQQMRKPRSKRLKSCFTELSHCPSKSLPSSRAFEKSSSRGLWDLSCGLSWLHRAMSEQTPKSFEHIAPTDDTGLHEAKKSVLRGRIPDSLTSLCAFTTNPQVKNPNTFDPRSYAPHWIN